MRYLIILWAAPLALFWGWYGLSAHDINLGTVYLSRELHDLIFRIYGQTLGVEPETIPPMLASASIIDSLLIGAIAAFRWRARWLPRFSTWVGSRLLNRGPGEDADLDGSLAEAEGFRREGAGVIAFTAAPYDRARPAE